MNGLEHAHLVLRILCLDCASLVVGNVRLLIEVGGIFHVGHGLDIPGRDIVLFIVRVVHLG